MSADCSSHLHAHERSLAASGAFLFRRNTALMTTVRHSAQEVSERHACLVPGLGSGAGKLCIGRPRSHLLPAFSYRRKGAGARPTAGVDTPPQHPTPPGGQFLGSTALTEPNAVCSPAVSGASDPGTPTEQIRTQVVKVGSSLTAS